MWNAEKKKKKRVVRSVVVKRERAKVGVDAENKCLGGQEREVVVGTKSLGAGCK
jgi:hypothetical protein